MTDDLTTSTSQTSTKLLTTTTESSPAQESSTETISLSTGEQISSSASTGPKTLFTTKLSTQAVTSTTNEETGTFSTKPSTFLTTVPSTILPLSTTPEGLLTTQTSHLPTTTSELPATTAIQTVMSESTLSPEVNNTVSSTPMPKTISTSSTSPTLEIVSTSIFSTLSTRATSVKETSEPLETSSLHSSSSAASTAPTTENVSSTVTDHASTLMSQASTQLPSVPTETSPSQEPSTTQTTNQSTREQILSSTSIESMTVFSTKLSTQSVTSTTTEETGTFSSKPSTLLTTLSSTIFPLPTTPEGSLTIHTSHLPITTSTLLATTVKETVVSKSTFSPEVNNNVSSTSLPSSVASSASTPVNISTKVTDHPSTLKSQTSLKLSTVLTETSTSPTSTTKSNNFTTREQILSSTSIGKRTLFPTELSTKAITHTKTEKTSSFSTEPSTSFSTASFTILPVSAVTHESDYVPTTNVVTSLPMQQTITKSTTHLSVSVSNPTRSLTESSQSLSSNDQVNITQTFSTVTPVLSSTTVKTSFSSSYSRLNTSTTVITTEKISTLSTTPKLCTNTENKNCSYQNGICSCVCNQYLIGNECEYGKNETSAVLPERKGPTRNISVEFTIYKTFTISLNDKSSPEYSALYNQIIDVLKSAFKHAAPDYFLEVAIHGFRNGSIIVDSTAIFKYPNNQTGIDFINNDLESAMNSSLVQSMADLTEILKANVFISKIQAGSPTITKVEQMKKYVSCSLNYAGYIVTCNSIYCYCTGPCFNNPGYCHYHGDCFNAANGSICQCYKYDFYQYQGEQCELYERRSGFYGLIFGLIGGALLLLIVLIFAVFVLRKKRMFKLFNERRNSKTWFTYDEERTNFQHTDMDDVARSGITNLAAKFGKYDLETNSFNSSDSSLSAGVYRPRLDKVDTSQPFKIQRPEMVSASIEQK
ncbi:mucin-3A-like [Bufo bufo]|uniref:mucin-3A-like n=1 Tax=Bufo bufo TaxID=8384 RepID=UPI001ABED3BB|nr:mucin-3A-like [Bufo bufo]